MYSFVVVCLLCSFLIIHSVNTKAHKINKIDVLLKVCLAGENSNLNDKNTDIICVYRENISNAKLIEEGALLKCQRKTYKENLMIYVCDVPSDTKLIRYITDLFQVNRFVRKTVNTNEPSKVSAQTDSDLLSEFAQTWSIVSKNLNLTVPQTEIPWSINVVTTRRSYIFEVIFNNSLHFVIWESKTPAKPTQLLPENPNRVVNRLTRSLKTKQNSKKHPANKRTTTTSTTPTPTTTFIETTTVDLPFSSGKYDYFIKALFNGTLTTNLDSVDPLHATVFFTARPARPKTTTTMATFFLDGKEITTKRTPDLLDFILPNQLRLEPGDSVQQPEGNLFSNGSFDLLPDLPVSTTTTDRPLEFETTTVEVKKAMPFFEMTTNDFVEISGVLNTLPTASLSTTHNYLLDFVDMNALKRKPQNPKGPDTYWYNSKNAEETTTNVLERSLPSIYWSPLKESPRGHRTFKREFRFTKKPTTSKPAEEVSRKEPKYRFKWMLHEDERLKNQTNVPFSRRKRESSNLNTLNTVSTNTPFTTQLANATVVGFHMVEKTKKLEPSQSVPTSTSRSRRFKKTFRPVFKTPARRKEETGLNHLIKDLFVPGKPESTNPPKPPETPWTLPLNEFTTPTLTPAEEAFKVFGETTTHSFHFLLNTLPTTTDSVHNYLRYSLDMDYLRSNQEKRSKPWYYSTTSTAPPEPTTSVLDKHLPNCLMVETPTTSREIEKKQTNSSNSSKVKFDYSFKDLELNIPANQTFYEVTSKKTYPGVVLDDADLNIDDGDVYTSSYKSSVKESTTFASYLLVDLNTLPSTTAPSTPNYLDQPINWVNVIQPKPSFNTTSTTKSTHRQSAVTAVPTISNLPSDFEQAKNATIPSNFLQMLKSLPDSMIKADNIVTGSSTLPTTKVTTSRLNRPNKVMLKRTKAEPSLLLANLVASVIFNEGMTANQSLLADVKTNSPIEPVTPGKVQDPEIINTNDTSKVAPAEDTNGTRTSEVDVKNDTVSINANHTNVTNNTNCTAKGENLEKSPNLVHTLRNIDQKFSNLFVSIKSPSGPYKYFRSTDVQPSTSNLDNSTTEQPQGRREHKNVRRSLPCDYAIDNTNRKEASKMETTVASDLRKSYQYNGEAPAQNQSAAVGLAPSVYEDSLNKPDRFVNLPKLYKNSVNHFNGRRRNGRKGNRKPTIIYQPLTFNLITKLFQSNKNNSEVKHLINEISTLQKNGNVLLNIKLTEPNVSLNSTYDFNLKPAANQSDDFLYNLELFRKTNSSRRAPISRWIDLVSEILRRSDIVTQMLISTTTPSNDISTGFSIPVTSSASAPETTATPTPETTVTATASSATSTNSSSPNPTAYSLAVEPVTDVALDDYKKVLVISDSYLTHLIIESNSRKSVGNDRVDSPVVVKEATMTNKSLMDNATKLYIHKFINGLLGSQYICSLHNVTGSKQPAGEDEVVKDKAVVNGKADVHINVNKIYRFDDDKMSLGNIDTTTARPSIKLDASPSSYSYLDPYSSRRLFKGVSTTTEAGRISSFPFFSHVFTSTQTTNCKNCRTYNKFGGKTNQYLEKKLYEYDNSDKDVKQFDWMITFPLVKDNAFYYTKEPMERNRFQNNRMSTKPELCGQGPNASQNLFSTSTAKDREVLLSTLFSSSFSVPKTYTIISSTTTTTGIPTTTTTSTTTASTTKTTSAATQKPARVSSVRVFTSPYTVVEKLDTAQEPTTPKADVPEKKRTYEIKHSITNESIHHDPRIVNEDLVFPTWFLPLDKPPQRAQPAPRASTTAEPAARVTYIQRNPVGTRSTPAPAELPDWLTAKFTRTAPPVVSRKTTQAPVEKWVKVKTQRNKPLWVLISESKNDGNNVKRRIKRKNGYHKPEGGRVKASSKQKFLLFSLLI